MISSRVCICDEKTFRADDNSFQISFRRIALLWVFRGGRSRMLIQSVLSVILAVSVSGVSPRGTKLLGRVSDGATPIAGAIVTISNRGFVKSTTTDGDGRFILEPVPSGR